MWLEQPERRAGRLALRGAGSALPLFLRHDWLPSAGAPGASPSIRRRVPPCAARTISADGLRRSYARGRATEPRVYGLPTTGNGRIGKNADALGLDPSEGKALLRGGLKSESQTRRLFVRGPTRRGANHFATAIRTTLARVSTPVRANLEIFFFAGRSCRQKAGRVGCRKGCRKG